MACIRITGNGILLAIKAIPNASKSQCAGIAEDRLRIKIAAAPEDGKANAELRAFLSKALDCPKKDIAVIAGEKSRLKTLSLPPALKEKLETLLKTQG